jgi:membrane-associated phospholipid phosphatase
MRARTQLGVFLAAYVLYDVARWITVGHVTPATEHAHWVLDLERTCGLAVERSVQDALAGGAVMWLLSNIYLAAQLVVLPGSLLWLFRRDQAVYRRLRDTIIATWMLAVPIYAAFPVAPPRLAGIGIADTVSQQAAVGLTGHSTAFYNPYAAVPSLHCGFAFVIGIALAAACRRPLTKALWLLWGPTVSLAVVATGNHYVFDIAVGLLVAGAGYLLGRLPRRLPAGLPLLPLPRLALSGETT